MEDRVKVLESEVTKCLKMKDEVSYLNANLEETKIRVKKLCEDKD